MYIIVIEQEIFGNVLKLLEICFTTNFSSDQARDYQRPY